MYIYWLRGHLFCQWVSKWRLNAAPITRVLVTKLSHCSTSTVVEYVRHREEWMQICEGVSSGLLIFQNIIGLKEEICRFLWTLKSFQLRQLGASPLTPNPGSATAPEPCWGLPPQTTIIGSCSMLAMPPSISPRLTLLSVDFKYCNYLPIR